VLLFDVNVWIYAHREETEKHKQYRAFVESVLVNDSAYGVSPHVLSSFLRIVTHPKVFDPPTPLEIAIQFANEILLQPDVVVVSPGSRHWDIFIELCKSVEAKGNLIPDAYFAAMVIESGCTWVSADRDYARFPNLVWKHPLSDF